MRNSMFHFILTVLIVVQTFSLTGCSLNDDNGRSSRRDEERKSSSKKDDGDDIWSFKSYIGKEENKSSKKDEKEKSPFKIKPESSSSSGNYKNLVINDFPIAEEDMIVEVHKNSTYILLSREIIEFPFKMPGLYNGYPELSLANSRITLTWTDNNDNIVLLVEMSEGSPQAYINGMTEPVDMVVGPKTVNGTLFIPINILYQIFEMKETYDKQLDRTFLHYKEDFPAELLVGTWSNAGTNLFAVKDVVTGLESMSSYAVGYVFDEKGNYRFRGIYVGGYEDAFVEQHGKYKILGNTVIYYDIRETLYKGEPLMLVHENVRRENPSYEFIQYYKQDKKEIDLGFDRLTKIN